MSKTLPSLIPLDSPKAYFNRELSWLAFARRVLAQVVDPQVPLLEQVRFLGIVGMLHDEFFMKRMSGLKRQISKKSSKLSLDGRSPQEEFEVCRQEVLAQIALINRYLKEAIAPALAGEGIPIIEYKQLKKPQRAALRNYFRDAILPILTPLAVDQEHPFPFISNFGLNLAVLLPSEDKRQRFIRIKVPDNRPRWVAVPEGEGFVPLEQVIAANLDLLYPEAPPRRAYVFRVTRGAEGEPDSGSELQESASDEPGSIIRQVGRELKARRFAGVVRLQVGSNFPKKLTNWLAKQLGANDLDVYKTSSILGLKDLSQLDGCDRPELCYSPYKPVAHPRLSSLPTQPGAIFQEIDRGDILLHHPYHSFDSSVLRFIESAVLDPAVLAIKLTIYRTSADSPIIKALAEASRRGKQVAVLLEVTARFDEAPNIAWGRYLEQEGVHVAYGVERLKTHVKLALVVREEGGQVSRYAHFGTGNYHSGTARFYEDVGVLTSDDDICADVASIFNALTGGTLSGDQRRILVAPVTMRRQINTLIRREAEHARSGRVSGIEAKLNQLQDPALIRELYQAGQAGVPIRLNVRGLCCLRPGVAGLSENIKVSSVVGRFLEHSRIYAFSNGGEPESYIGSADWMKRNLNSRVETVVPILDEQVKLELQEILQFYIEDNCSAWDCLPDGTYKRRSPACGEVALAVQDVFMRMASIESARPRNLEASREAVIEVAGDSSRPAPEKTSVRIVRSSPSRG